jgi:pyruvate dehydrogenase E1 component alpha subunit
MAELFGRSDGCSGGKGGSMHLFDAAKKFWGGHGIVGAQVPLAAGLAWAAKYRNEERVVLCFVGDAAVNQGAFHEALNMAAIWELPLILAVENNEYGMGTAFRRVSRTEIADKACAYGIPASVVNGQDVLETYTHFGGLAAEVRGGGGPRYVDVQTYRFKGHSMSDPVAGTYRSKKEVEGRVREADPIGVLRETLFDAGVLDQDGLQAMDEEARATAQDAFDFADQSPVPEAEELYTHVYAELNPHGRLFFDGRERPEASE